MKLGVLGGGQLARMMVPPAHNLGLEIYVLERADHCPAKLAGAHQVVGDWADPATVARFCRGLDVVTLDHEFAPMAALEAAEQETILRPGLAAMSLIANKLTQKEMLVKAGLKVTPSRACANASELQGIGDEFGWPLMVKTQRGGYDGKGNWLVQEATAELDWGVQLYAEQFVPFKRELAIMVVRNPAGEVRTYPVVETIQENHICVAVKYPAAISDSTRKKATEAAIAAAQALDMVGALGVEMFERQDGEIAVNELAPRPHNSGHYTMDACHTCQFENHVRAVMGWPLGSTTPKVSSAVMLNLLGDGFGDGRPQQGLQAVLAADKAHLHLYAKASKPARKLGHLTLTGEDTEQLHQRGTELQQQLSFAQQERVTP